MPKHKQLSPSTTIHKTFILLCLPQSLCYIHQSTVLYIFPYFNEALEMLVTFF